MVCAMQIADFGMARDITDANYYVTKGGKIPAKWTPPEVCMHAATSFMHILPCAKIST